MLCSQCGKQFDLKADHKGLANVCLNCGGEDVDRLMAKVIWSGKQTVEIEITNQHDAKLFNSRNKRFGCSILSCIATAKNPSDREASKAKSGAELRAMYHSSLGEKHHLKG